MIGADSHIRLAVPADAATIARIYVETWRSAYPGMLPDRVLTGMSELRQEGYWRGILGSRGGRDFVLAAEVAGAGVVGFAGAGPARPAAGGYRGEIYTLYVLSDHQGRGLGRLLLTAARDALARRELTPVLVWVLAENPSRFFYRAMGGAPVAERESAMGGARHREVAYGWAEPGAGPGAAR